MAWRAFSSRATSLSLAASPASAAKPKKGARYLAPEGGLVPSVDEDFVTGTDVELRVSRSGRKLGRSSSVRLRCGRNYSEVVRLRRPHRKSLRIRRGGRFSLAKRKGRLRFRLRGRFVTRDYAKVVYKVRRGSCRSRRHVVRAYRNGKPSAGNCRSQPGRKLAKNGRGRAYELLTYEGSGQFFTHAYACSFETNKQTDLGHDYDETLVEAVRLAGPYVGYYAFGGDEFSTGGDIVVRDLRNGRSLRNLGAFGLDDVKLVLKENGSVAWTSVPNALEPTSPKRIELRAADGLGERVLDPGPQVDPSSVRLSGSTLTWRSGGAARSTVLH